MRYERAECQFRQYYPECPGLPGKACDLQFPGAYIVRDRGMEHQENHYPGYLGLTKGAREQVNISVLVSV